METIIQKNLETLKGLTILKDNYSTELAAVTKFSSRNEFHTPKPQSQLNLQTQYI